MKLALIFLATLVVITHQQLQRTRGMLWLSPYLQWPAINNFQPIYYDEIKEYIPFFRHLSHPQPFTDSFARENSILISFQVFNNGETIFRMTSCIRTPHYWKARKTITKIAINQGAKAKWLHRISSRMLDIFSILATTTQTKSTIHFSRRLPSFWLRLWLLLPFNHVYQVTSLQFLYRLLVAVSVLLTLTCLKTTNFSSPLQKLYSKFITRLKFRHIDEKRSLPILGRQKWNWLHLIYRLTATVSPSLTQMRNKRQLQINEMASYDLLSSKVDEATLGEVPRNLLNHKTKEKRFFFKPNANYFVVSTTVTSYFFVNTIVTQTVTLGPAGDAVNPGNVLCLPFGYTTCAPVAV